MGQLWWKYIILKPLINFSYKNLRIAVAIATPMVAIKTPCARSLWSLLINKKNAAIFNNAPIIINLIKTPLLNAMSIDSFKELP